MIIIYSIYDRQKMLLRIKFDIENVLLFHIISIDMMSIMHTILQKITRLQKGGNKLHGTHRLVVGSTWTNNLR